LFKNQHPDANINAPAPDAPTQVGIQVEILESKSIEYKTKEDTPEECCICLEKFEKKSKVNYLECKHVLHTKCLVDWMKKKNICPMCR
jgi:hypothetical protein